MQRLLIAVALAGVFAVAAHAQTTTCKATAAQKKLAGAALNSFMKKCEKDAAAACTKAATDKKLAGAAKASNVKKCTSDAVGT
ncbi:MAG TPA: hypothetical protein VFR73_24395 [Hyphomicrobiaceae bacterium]|jgi:hypothetical protein|nr:hypothetical protein [Hyphomicrobiaceae bacterium]